MLKTRIGLAFILILFLCANVFGQVNKELVDDLNKALLLELTTRAQYEYHSDIFKITIPYSQIIPEKESTIESLTNIIVGFGGQPNKNFPQYEKAKAVLEALNTDANAEIGLLNAYDDILNKYGHQEVRRITETARQNSLRHFMLFTNTCQDMLIRGYRDK